MATPGPDNDMHTEPVVTQEWIIEQHRQQQEINAKILDFLQNMQPSQQAPPTSQPPVQSVAEPAIASGQNQKPKHSLSHPDKYDGESKTAYPAFKGHLRAKLRIDQAAIGGEAEQVWYGFGRLSGKAAERMYPWINAIDSQGKPLLVDDFFEQLDAAFYDVQIPQKALEWINSTKQKSTPFREFLQKFEQKLLEAGGWGFSDHIRKGFLKAALNVEIRAELVGRDEPESYTAFVNMIRKTADDLDQVKRMKQSRNAWGTVRQDRPPETEDTMDWEPTPKTAAGRASNRPRNSDNGRTRATWVSRNIIEERRTNGKCLRCGSSDHFIGNCGYLPPQRPQSAARPRGAAVKEPSEEPRTSSKAKAAKAKKMKAPRPQIEEGTESDLDTTSESENE